MGESYAVERFDGAVLLLPYWMRDRLRELTRFKRATAEELRLRINEPISVVLPEGEVSLGGDEVTKRDLEFVLELATGASAHSVQDRLKSGFLTVRGGYRLGLCGSVAVREGRVSAFQSVSSIALRIARQAKGCGEEVMKELENGGELPSTLIVSPPGGGKTTLLRDIIRIAASGKRPLRVAVADERSEIAAYYDGSPRMDVGHTTDILDGCPKAEGVQILLRSMNPEIIAVDEITTPEDADAILSAANCGVRLIATAHAADYSELSSRAVYRRLIEAGVFSAIVTVRRERGERSYEVRRLGQ